MALADRRKMSLYDEAKAGLSSLVKQTAQVFIGLLFMLLLTGGNPPSWVVALSFVSGIGFVAWSENKRLTELEDANLSDSPETLFDTEQHTATSEDSAPEKVPQQDVNLPNFEALIPQDISRNKRLVLKRSFALFSDSQEISALIQQVVETQTDDFLQLAKIAGLNPAEDFAGANLSRANLSGAKLSRVNLSGANLGGANLSGANLSGASLIGAYLIDAKLSGANLSDANLYGADLSGANLSRANLIGADLSDPTLYDADLSGANVEKARFGWNKGLAEDMKLDLKRRGAIFEDSLGDRSNISTPV